MQVKHFHVLMIALIFSIRSYGQQVGINEDGSLPDPVDVWSKFFKRRISITMQDGEKHLFSYGAISTGRIREALIGKE